MSESVLTALKDDLSPQRGVQARIAKKMQGNMAKGTVFEKIRPEISPSKHQRKTVWNRIAAQIDISAPLTLLDQVRGALAPSSSLALELRSTILGRLQPRFVQPVSYRTLKWTAAFAVVALLVRASPFLFIASPTVADSAVTLIPTKGSVYVSIGDLWQPVTSEITLQPGMLLKTEAGEASVLFHDDGVIRLDRDTSIAIHDTSSRRVSASELLPTFTLYTGRLWVQGLVPSHNRGLTVSTRYGHVTVQQGSISIAEDDDVLVEVYDRRAQIAREGTDSILVSGERTVLREGRVLVTKKMGNALFESQWAVQNLGRDAVHRREIAQIQHERRAASAGILPTSKLYPAKRIAERVDVLLTLGEDARTQKKIAHAQTRLDEAAAMLQEDEQEFAAGSLAEYRKALVALADDSEDNSLAVLLLQQSIRSSTADIAASLPNDESYILKQTVLEASAAVDSVVQTDDMQGILLADTLAVLTDELVSGGDVAEIRATWYELQPYLTLLDSSDSPLPLEVQKDLKALLQRFAIAVTDRAQYIEDPEMTQQLARYVPRAPGPVHVIMTEEEVQQIVQSIRERIFVYNMRQSRINQLVAELRALDGHPEQGRILRRLHAILPDGPEHFPVRLRRELTRVRWEKAGEVL